MLDALKAENESLKAVLKNTNAEKTAIDQLCMQTIRENVMFRAQLELLKGELAEVRETFAKVEKVDLEVVKDSEDTNVA